MSEPQPPVQAFGQVKFGEEVLQVLTHAPMHSIDMGHEYIGTEHLLLALLRSEAPEARKLFARLKLDRDAVAQAIVNMVKEGKAKGIKPPLPYTSRSKKVIALAETWATKLDVDIVGIGCLLLGMIEEEKGIAAQILSDFGVGLTAAVATVRTVLIETDENFIRPTIDNVDEDEDISNLSPMQRELLKQLDPALRQQSTLTIIADLSRLDAASVAEIMASLDLLHRAWGGAGLEMGSEYVGVAQAGEVTA